MMSVAGHEVQFDNARRLWYADLELNAGGSYWPFVRLALARYQPESRGDCHLSRVVSPSSSQLLPDRSVEIAIGERQAHAHGRRLRHRVERDRRRSSGSRPIRCGSIPSRPPPIVVHTQRGGLNEFDIEVEILDPALGEDFGWSRSTASRSALERRRSRCGVARIAVATTALKRAAKAEGRRVRRGPRPRRA